jgi:Icc-related predicted phosphoesterase
VRIQIMSDLHIKHWGTHMGRQWWQDGFPAMTQTDADVLILAGDIVDLCPRDWRWSVARLQEFVQRYKHVVYVPGNHEYYSTSIDDVSGELPRLAQQTGVNVLYPGVRYELEGRQFHGGTLFQPWPAEDDYDPNALITDHYAISDFMTEAQRHFKDLRNHLEDRLRSGDIVVTHHAPSNLSIADQWKGHPCNRWFITPEMEPLIESRKPALWVHGHVHTPFDYLFANSRVICNPMGYPGEGVKFNPKLVVEI